MRRAVRRKDSRAPASGSLHGGQVERQSEKETGSEHGVLEAKQGKCFWMTGWSALEQNPVWSRFNEEAETACVSHLFWKFVWLRKRIKRAESCGGYWIQGGFLVPIFRYQSLGHCAWCRKWPNRVEIIGNAAEGGMICWSLRRMKRETHGEQVPIWAIVSDPPGVI